VPTLDQAKAEGTPSDGAAASSLPATDGAARRHSWRGRGETLRVLPRLCCPGTGKKDELFAEAMSELRRRKLVTGRSAASNTNHSTSARRAVGRGLLIRELWRDDGGEVHLAVAVRDAASDSRICHLLDAIDTLR